MKIKMLILLVLALAMLSIVKADSASLPAIMQGQCMPLVEYCANCTSVNFTTISYPNQTVQTLNYLSSLQSQDTYVNNSFCNTGTLGTYIYSAVGDPNGVIVSQSVSRDVTLTGYEFTTQQGILYGVLFLFACCCFALLMYGSFAIEWGNERSQETGFMIGINWMKYAKIFCIAFSYLSFMIITYTVFILSSAYLNLNFVSSLFQSLFYTEVWLILPIACIIIIITIARLINDIKLDKMINGGEELTDE